MDNDNSKFLDDIEWLKADLQFKELQEELALKQKRINDFLESFTNSSDYLKIADSLPEVIDNNLVLEALKMTSSLLIKHRAFKAPTIRQLKESYKSLQNAFKKILLLMQDDNLMYFLGLLDKAFHTRNTHDDKNHSPSLYEMTHFFNNFNMDVFGKNLTFINKDNFQLLNNFFNDEPSAILTSTLNVKEKESEVPYLIARSLYDFFYSNHKKGTEINSFIHDLSISFSKFLSRQHPLYKNINVNYINMSLLNNLTQQSK